MKKDKSPRGSRTSDMNLVKNDVSDSVSPATPRKAAIVADGALREQSTTSSDDDISAEEQQSAKEEENDPKYADWLRAFYSSQRDLWTQVDELELEEDIDG